MYIYIYEDYRKKPSLFLFDVVYFGRKQEISRNERKRKREWWIQNRDEEEWENDK
jgi:hypothetical protein